MFLKIKCFSFKIFVLLLLVALSSCSKPHVAPNPKTFYKPGVKIDAAKIDVIVHDQNSSRELEKFHLKQQIHQWALDRFRKESKSNDSIVITISTKINRSSHMKKDFFFVKEESAVYDASVGVLFEKINENGEVVAFFQFSESAKVNLDGDFSAEFEREEVDAAIFDMIEKIDLIAMKKLKKLNWLV